VRELARGARIVTASVGDHPLVLHLLMQAQQAALTEDFQSRLDEPGYRPSNRLLLRRDKQLWGHVHLGSHIAWFEGQRMPIVNLEDFAVLPEYCASELDAGLLHAAEDMAAADGAVVGLVHTQRGDWFERQGWSGWRGQGHTRANARTLLAHIDPHEPARRRKRAGVEVSLWRHYELDSLRHIYATAACRMWGPLCRSEQSWQWLVGRKAQDQILVAVQKGSRKEANGLATVRIGQEPAVGYAVVRGSAIIEMMTLPHCSGARVQLLAAA
jgi:predicted acetyltransferase